VRGQTRCPNLPPSVSSVMTFVFYDLETTGISPAFDQPLQFAAIRTDDHFNEIERVNLRCRLAPHILPSPHALLVTGVTPEQLIDPSLPDAFTFTQMIAELTQRWAPATWVGYNTIKFDEEMLRQAFYQNLQPNLYATQFNGNLRFDVLGAVYAARVRNPGLFQWPVDDQGKVSFRLDRLAPANGFLDHDAHDALGDVKVTIHIARRIARDDPTLWSNLLALRDKQQTQQRLETFRPMELIVRFGGGAPRSITGCFCGRSASYSNEVLFLDLDAVEPGSLVGGSDDAIVEALSTSPKVIRAVAVNKAPLFFDVPEPKREHSRRAQIIADSPEFRARVGRALASRFASAPDPASLPVEKQIYAGFYSDGDKRLLDRFQTSDWAQRRETLDQLQDARLRQLGRRLVAFHAPELLSPAERVQFVAFVRDRWSAPDVPETEWMTLEKARSAINDLHGDIAVDQHKVDDIAVFIDERERWLS